MNTPSTNPQEEQRTPQRQNMEQRRGRKAWSDIEFIERENQQKNRNNLQSKDALLKEYRTRASQLNSMIQTNGLGQTLGFLKAKAREKDDKDRVNPNAHYYLLSHLTQWMRSSSFDPAIPDTFDGLLKWITVEAESVDYRRATTECLAFGTWLRRFAEGELKEKDTGATKPATTSQEGGI